VNERPAPADAKQHGVVLLHGISRTALSFRKMQLALERAGFATLNLDYASRSKALEALAEDIHPAIQPFADRMDGSIHFVCHSMGGLLARVYIARHRPQRLGRVVMLGTPNSGSEIADRLKNFGVYRAFFGPAGQQLGTQRDDTINALFPPPDYSAGIIAGSRSIDLLAGSMLPKPHDGRVSVANTRLEGMADHVVVRTSHPFLVRNGEAIAQTIAFLKDGNFIPSTVVTREGEGFAKVARDDSL
jgi:pimeloyl-ACP methyl ester carboxylesterase